MLNVLKRRSRVRRVGNASLTVALVVIGALAITAALAPWLPLNPNAQNLDLRLASPREALPHGWQYVLGGDQLGRPILSRTIHGARLSLLIGVLVPLFAGIVGVTIGLIAAEVGGVVDQIIMRIIDVWMSMPALLVALTVLYLSGPGFLKTVLVLTIMRWMVFARLARAAALSARERDFVEAGRVVGSSRTAIVRRHVLPAISGTLAVLVGLEGARAILAAASLSFLGLGIQPPQSDWGTMLADGRHYMAGSPLVTLVPGLAIVASTLSLNIIVDRVRSVFASRGM